MRHLRVVVLASVLVVLLLAPSAEAQVEVMAGVGYNTYSIDWTAMEMETEFFNTGMGASAGLRYWFTDSIALHGGIDYLSGSGSETIPAEDIDDDGIPDLPALTNTLDLTAIGYGGGAALRIPVGPRLSLIPFAGVASYGGTIDSKSTTTDPFLGSSTITLSVALNRVIGYQAGVEAGYDVGGGLRLGASAAYRSLAFTRGTFEFLGAEITQEFDPPFDLSGVRLQAGFSYAF